MAALPPPAMFNVVRLVVRGALQAHGASSEAAAEWLGITPKRFKRALKVGSMTHWGNIALFGGLMGLSPDAMVTLISWTRVQVEAADYGGDAIQDFPEIWELIQRICRGVDLRQPRSKAPSRSFRQLLPLLPAGFGDAPVRPLQKPTEWLETMLDFPELRTPEGALSQGHLKGLADELSTLAKKLTAEAETLRPTLETLATRATQGRRSREFLHR